MSSVLASVTDFVSAHPLWTAAIGALTLRVVPPMALIEGVFFVLLSLMRFLGTGLSLSLCKLDVWFIRLFCWFQN